MGKITIRDVARESGVSISLVSLVMNAKRDAEGNLDCNVNKDTASRIREVAKRLGYRPNKAAASLRSGRFYTIGMITSDISNEFFADIARYIENIAHNHNYMVLFGSSDENAEKLDNIIDTFIGSGVEGLIVAPCAGSEEVLRKALEAGIPTVLLDRDLKGVDAGRVMLDNERAGRMGVEHLYENGYRRIEMISYTLGISSLSEREEGYREAMRRFGLEGYSQIHYTIYGNAQEDLVRIFEDGVRRGVEAFLLPTNTLALLGAAGAQHAQSHLAQGSGAGGIRRERDFHALQADDHPYHAVDAHAGREVVRDAATHDRGRRRLPQRGDRTNADRRRIDGLHLSRARRGRPPARGLRRGAHARRLRAASRNLFSA